MSRFIKVLLLTVVMLVVSLPAHALDKAASFVEIVRDENFLAYVDLSSIKSYDDYVVAWVKWIPRGKIAAIFKRQFGTDISFQMQLDAFDKNRKLKQVLAMHVYDKENMLVHKSEEPFFEGNYEEIVPQTYAYDFYDFVMLNYKER